MPAIDQMELALLRNLARPYARACPPPPLEVWRARADAPDACTWATLAMAGIRCATEVWSALDHQLATASRMRDASAIATGILRRLVTGCWFAADLFSDEATVTITAAPSGASLDVRIDRFPAQAAAAFLYGWRVKAAAISRANMDKLAALPPTRIR